MPQVHIDSYRTDGFLVLEGLISSRELDALRAEAVKLCRGEYPCEALPPVSPATTDEDALRRYLCIHHPHKLSPYLREVVAHPAIADVLSQIVAPNVKCMQSMFFIKPPRFPGQAWHQDEIYIPTRDRSLTGAWIALDDATVENGCLWVIPGSHADGYLYPQRDHHRPEEFDASQESYGFDDTCEVPVECAAGAVVFFSGYLLHRSRKNRSDRYRRVLVNHYMNAYSLLPWRLDASCGDRVANADYRDVILVAGHDPYAWRGTVDLAAVYSRRFDPAALVKE